MSAGRLILTTTATRPEAERIARALIEERLAACVQIEAIESWYRWQGRIERTPEFRLQIKTSTARSAATVARIGELHGYDLPEIVTLPIEGSAAYLAWIGTETAG